MISGKNFRVGRKRQTERLVARLQSLKELRADWVGASPFTSGFADSSARPTASPDFA